MTTPLYPVFQKRIYDATEVLLHDQVFPWAMLNAGKPMRVKTFFGKEINYEGGFEGSPRQVFWDRYIDPFLEAMIVSELSAAVAMAKERGVDARQLLPEMLYMLEVACIRVFAHMADIDRNLLGKGFPESVHVRPVDRELARFKHFVSVRVDSELAMWKPQPKSTVTDWFNNNPFWVWIIGGAAASVLAVFVALLS